MYTMECYIVNKIDKEIECNLLNGILRTVKFIKRKKFITLQFYMDE